MNLHFIKVFFFKESIDFFITIWSKRDNSISFDEIVHLLGIDPGICRVSSAGYLEISRVSQNETVVVILPRQRIFRCT